MLLIKSSYSLTLIIRLGHIPSSNCLINVILFCSVIVSIDAINAALVDSGTFPALVLFFLA